MYEIFLFLFSYYHLIKVYMYVKQTLSAIIVLVRFWSRKLELRGARDFISGQVTNNPVSVFRNILNSNSSKFLAFPFASRKNNVFLPQSSGLFVEIYMIVVIWKIILKSLLSQTQN